MSDGASTFAPMACNDDSNGTVASSVTVGLRANTDYYVRIGGFAFDFGFVALYVSGIVDVTAPIVYVNYGLPADYGQLAARGVDVRGKLAIARYGRSHIEHLLDMLGELAGLK